MGLAILRPDGHVSGADAAFGKLNDNSDATYVQDSSNRYHFGTVALPALAQVRTVTPRVRHNGGTSPSYFYLYLSTSTSYSDPYFAEQFLTPGNSVIVTEAGAPKPNNPSGSPWTQANIDGLVMEFALSGIGSIRYYELYLDVAYNEAPVTVVTGPADEDGGVAGNQVTSTTRPTVTFTYTDPDSDAKERDRVKIFSAAQYGAGGFDPETSAATWDSGERFTAALSCPIPIDLVNGTTYRAYVKSADAGSGGRYGAWANYTFTIAVAAPPAPTLVVTAQPANATGPRNKIDVTRTAHATPTTYMVVEYSDDGGATWAIARGGSKIMNSPDGTTFTIYDYESIPRVQRGYRAKAVRTV